MPLRELTVNLGLRYDYSAPWTEVNGKLSNLAPNGSLLVAGEPGLDRFYRPDRNNFAPRAGLAYDISGSGSTVIRAGFSIVYETLLQANSVQQVENNPPYSASAVTRSPTPFPPSRTRQNPSGSPRTGAALASHCGRGLLRLPKPRFDAVQLRSAAAAGQGWLLELAYAGSRGLHLPFFFNANQVPLRSLTAGQRDRIQQAIAAGQDTTPILSTLRPWPALIPLL